jgi:hypothetical protein
MYRIALRAKLRTEMTKKAKKQTSCGRNHDQARVAGVQDYETRYEAKKTGASLQEP